MRLALFCVVLFLAASSTARASSNLPPVAPPTPEEKAQSELTKGLSQPDKSARMAALTAFENAKPVTARSTQLLSQAAASDPDADVRYTAYAALAKMPAHDTSIAKTLVALFDSQKPNDWKTRVFYAKAMEPSPFKADTAGALADQLTKMRWPEDPKGYRMGKPSDKYKDEIKQKREEMTAMLDAFNAIAKSNVSTADKETNIMVKKWWDANQNKLLKADAELLEKIAKADAEAEKAAKLAKAEKK